MKQETKKKRSLLEKKKLQSEVRLAASPYFFLWLVLLVNVFPFFSQNCERGVFYLI